MTSAIRYGIDLGTTNSAIAVGTAVGDSVRIIKNREQMEVTASAVRIEKNGSMQVGRRAYETHFADPDNVATEFKRWMGEKESKEFKASGRILNAEELSAEILKSLLADARKHTGEEINSAVITVPAAFGNLQCEATAHAATLAGLEEAPLLPEPIAAAVAYGLEKSSVDQHWLVYDWGGGTFDTAIVSTRGGRLQVLAHRGDNRLGGKDIDRIIMEEVLQPMLAKRFNVPTEGCNPKAYRLLSQALKGKAEEIKKELSFSSEMPVSIFNVGSDNDGKPMELEFNFTRSDFEGLIMPLIDQTIDFCKMALEDARLVPEQLERIILVGGSTFIPLVRQKLFESFTVDQKYSIDPITVVARGAALYALARPSKLKKRVVEKIRPGVLCFELSHPLASSEETFPVAGNCRDVLGITGLEIKIEAEGNYWHSGWIAADDGYFELEAKLLPGRACRFWIYARDSQGRLHEVEPECFQVMQRALETADPPLSHSIGLEITDLGDSKIENIFRRSAPIPTNGLEWSGTYQTTRDLLPTREGPNEYIALKLYEGESSYPGENNFAGAIVIRPRHIKRPLPKGSEIELHVKIDQSRLIEAWAYVPVLDLSLEGLYERDAGKGSFEGVIRDQADRIYDVVINLEQGMHVTDDLDLKDKLIAIKEEADRLLLKASNLSSEEYAMGDQREQVFRQVQKIKNDLSLIVEESNREDMAAEENEKLTAELESEIALLTDLAELPEAELTENQVVGLDRIIEKSEEILAETSDRMQYRKRKMLVDSAKSLKISILFRQSWWWEEQLDWLSKPGVRFKDDTLAAEQLAKGQLAREKKDYDELKNVVSYLWKLLREREVAQMQKKSLEARITRKKK